MSPRGAEKLLSSLPKPARRGQFSASTKRALVEVAQELFTTQGYAGTSLDAIVAGAKVTKGALYHHFSGKQGIFEAVFEKVEIDASEHIRRALKNVRDPWDKAYAGLAAFLELVQDPGYQRIVIQEGPAILGYERFREREERSSYSIVREIVETVLGASEWELDEGLMTTFSQIFFGAMTSAGETVTNAADPQLAAAQVQTALSFILSGIRALADAGVEPIDPHSLIGGSDEADDADETDDADEAVDDETADENDDAATSDSEQ